MHRLRCLRLPVTGCHSSHVVAGASADAAGHDSPRDGGVEVYVPGEGRVNDAPAPLALVQQRAKGAHLGVIVGHA